MKAQVLEPPPAAQRRITVAAVLASVLLHAAVARGVSKVEPRGPDEPVWVELAVHAPPPPEPHPEPEPEPEPPAEPEPKPEPEVVKHDTIPPVPEPEPPPPPDPAPPPARRVQGLSNESFLPGSGTGLQVRAGSTTAVAAAEESMALEEADRFATVPWTQATKPPRVRYTPQLEVPPEVVEAAIVGRVEIELTVGPDGRVVDARVVQSLHPLADEACIRAMQKSRWKPGNKNGEPVTVAQVPYSCRFERLPG